MRQLVPNKNSGFKITIGITLSKRKIYEVISKIEVRKNQVL